MSLFYGTSISVFHATITIITIIMIRAIFHAFGRKGSRFKASIYNVDKRIGNSSTNLLKSDWEVVRASGFSRRNLFHHLLDHKTPYIKTGGISNF